MSIKRGFTFIEIMIAISVFSIGVLAVLNLIMYNLSSIDKMQTKILATFLAKEGLELVYNIRDSNIQKGLSRDCLLQENIENDAFQTEIPDVCKKHFANGESGLVFQFSFDPETYYYSTGSYSISGAFDELFDANRLYFYTGKVGNQNLFWYGYARSGFDGKETSFARYLRFAPVKEGDKILPNQMLLKVESHVLYKKAGYQGSVVLESFIGNY